MTNRASARRYARALFDVALAEGVDVRRVEQELTGFAQLVSSNETLNRALTNPAVPAPRKRRVVQELLARAPGMSAPLGKLLLMLAERDRLVLLPELVEAYRSRLMDHMKVVRAEVVTAQPLADVSVAALRNGLASATGRQVQLETRVNPEIIGGAVARIGSTVYDGSITRQLERMKEALSTGAD
jgi:F-type H+-transporting ATPase subunit delta